MKEVGIDTIRLENDPRFLIERNDQSTLMAFSLQTLQTLLR